MSHTLGVRQAQKQKTRQALLDAALQLLEEQSLSSLGLREVTRAVGVAPTAFYRHFRDMADLGVALVEEALSSLHTTLVSLLAATDDGDDGEERIAAAVELIVAYVRTHPAHVRFIAREQHGGVQAVRSAIGDQLTLFAQEVKGQFAREPESAGWDEDDLLMLARMYVDHMVMTASALLEAAPGTEEQVAASARRQLRLVSLGRRHWLDER
ncbi:MULTISPECIES: TetR family transcriptional regulator [unclassified Streptomyces]|uniref:TetR family transcriptional regulator n=1 Tax=unclassified Streptomyces TaxID=2593676 RepID=UPI00331898D4